MAHPPTHPPTHRRPPLWAGSARSVFLPTPTNDLHGGVLEQAVRREQLRRNVSSHVVLPIHEVATDGTQSACRRGGRESLRGPLRIDLSLSERGVWRGQVEEGGEGAAGKDRQELLAARGDEG